MRGKVHGPRSCRMRHDRGYAGCRITPHRASLSLSRSLCRRGIIFGCTQGRTTACLDDAPVHVRRMTVSFLSSHYIQRARFGSLSPYVKPYITLVLNEGYKPTTIVGQLRLIARLNRWLLRMGY